MPWTSKTLDLNERLACLNATIFAFFVAHKSLPNKSTNPFCEITMWRPTKLHLGCFLHDDFSVVLTVLAWLLPLNRCAVKYYLSSRYCLAFYSSHFCFRSKEIESLQYNNERNCHFLTNTNNYRHFDESFVTLALGTQLFPPNPKSTDIIQQPIVTTSSNFSSATYG